MKLPFSQPLFLLSTLCLLFSTAGYTQNQLPGLDHSVKIENLQPTTHLNPAELAHKNQPTLISVCDNDIVAPEVHCVTGNCLPTARAAYLISNNYGEPWGLNHNINTMNAVFGSGNWDTRYFEDAAPATLLTPNYKVIFLEGSYYAGYALQNFLAANSAALENWVAAGGALFINSASYNLPAIVDFGFDGVMFQSGIWGYQAHVEVPAYPIFNGPFVPANGDFTGNGFHYGAFYGNSGLTLLTGNGICLSEKTWGSGKVYFGCILPLYYDEPHPNVDNMYQNILADLNAQCKAGVVVAVDAGACIATVLDQSLDATATDDCVLASLTHDFAAAPSNTSLNGAVLPAGNTMVTWTATDAAGNTATCETLLSVRETEAPVITCPSDISVFDDPGSCTAKVDFSVTATDNCTLAPTIYANPASGNSFPNGATTVFATASDESYNQSSCSFVVTVTPNPEVCNGIDDDCNGWIDDGTIGETTVYRDYDGDGYGNPNNSILSGCPIPSGYVFNKLDCDDTNYYIQPGMNEYCNDIDDDCDGTIDEGVASPWYADTDGDGYGDPNAIKYACSQPQGFIYTAGDCDDSNSYVHPGALEDCTNLADENCDGILGDNNFTIEEVHTDVFCGSNPDGAISLTVSPAQNYPVFLWSNGTCCTPNVTNLNFGTYKVTVTNECGTTRTKTVVIQPSVEPALQVQMTGTDFICYGASDGFVNATPSDGCGGYTYQWENGSTDASISGLSGGTYQVVVTDACGCTRSGSFTITQPYQFSLYFSYVIALLDGTYFILVEPSGGTAPYKFRRSTPPSGYTDWSSSNGFLGVPSGDYVFEIEDAHGCTAQAPITLNPLSPRPIGTEGSTEQASEPSSVENRTSPATTASVKQTWSVSLFPNPNTGNFKVDLLQPATEGMAFGITDQSGKLLLEKQIEAGSQVQTVNAESLPAGLYFLQVVSEGKVVAVEKFVKQ